MDVAGGSTGGETVLVLVRDFCKYLSVYLCSDVGILNRKNLNQTEKRITHIILDRDKNMEFRGFALALLITRRYIKWWQVTELPKVRFGLETGQVNLEPLFLGMDEPQNNSNRYLYIEA